MASLESSNRSTNCFLRAASRRSHSRMVPTCCRKRARRTDVQTIPPETNAPPTASSQSSSLRDITAQQPFQLRFQMDLVAVRANSMAELGFRMAGHGGVELFPVIAVVTNFLAVGADWKEPLQLLHPLQRLFQFVKAFYESLLQLHD